LKSTNWKDIAELIGIAAIVASLIFVGLQMRQEQQIAMSQVWSDRNQLRSELAHLINDNSQIWIDGLNESELSEPELAKFEAMASLYFHKESAHFNQRASGISPDSPDAISYKLANMILSYPGLKSAWSRWSVLYRTGSPWEPFTGSVQRQLDEIAANRLPKIDFDYLVPL